MATKKEIIDYVMSSPANTNPNVLGSMLDGITEDDSTEDKVILIEETVTTESIHVVEEVLPFAGGTLFFSQIINADTIQVVFEGETYTCQGSSNGPDESKAYYYGADIQAAGGPDFSQFPFAIISGSSPTGSVRNAFITKKPGTYQIKIEVPQEDGSSANEWSIAQISFSNDSNYYYCVDLAYFDRDNHNRLTSDRIKVPGTDESISEIVVGYTVPLYKNQYFLPNKAIDRTDTLYRRASGQITDTGDGFLIEGDGMIKLRGDTGK